MLFVAFDYFQANPSSRQKRLEPGAKGVACIAAIDPYYSQPAESYRELFEHEASAIAILDVGRMDYHSQNQTQRVNQDMALSSHDLFACIVAAPSSVVRCFNALAVEDRSSRGFFFPLWSRTASRRES